MCLPERGHGSRRDADGVVWGNRAEGVFEEGKE